MFLAPHLATPCFSQCGMYFPHYDTTFPYYENFCLPRRSVCVIVIIIRYSAIWQGCGAATPIDREIPTATRFGPGKHRTGVRHKTDRIAPERHFRQQRPLPRNSLKGLCAASFAEYGTCKRKLLPLVKKDPPSKMALTRKNFPGALLLRSAPVHANPPNNTLPPFP